MPPPCRYKIYEIQTNRMCEVLNEILNGVNELEEMMVEYSEINSFLFSHNKMFMIASENAYKTPEYNHQPYTFKYGSYDMSNYLKNYV